MSIISRLIAMGARRNDECGTRNAEFIVYRSALIVSVVAMLIVAGCQTAKPELHAKGVAFADSLYSSSLIRMTDKTIDNYSGDGIENEYAKADYWNSDGTRVILRSNDGVFYLYDAVGFGLLESLDSLGGGQELEPRWSPTNPGVFYYLSGTRLMNYNLTETASHLVHDFHPQFPNCALITTGVEGDASQDQRYWAFMIDDSGYNVLAVCVYDRTLDSVVGVKTSFPGSVNFSTMDASGNHVALCYDTMPMQAFYRDFTHEVDFAHGAAGHSDIALTADGHDVMVYQNVSTDFIAMTDLETGVETNLQAIPFDVNPDIGMHFSGNCYAVPGWVLVSTYGAQNPPSGKTHSWMDNLLYMLELKDSARIVKIAQTHCYTPSPTVGNYFAEAYASINRAGTMIVYGSNWGVMSPIEYTDAYEVLPTDWIH